MKTISKKFNDFTWNLYCKINDAKAALSNTDGDAYIDTVIKILIAVVVGAALLWGIYKIMTDGDDSVIGQLGKKIKAIFDKTPTA